MMDRKSGKKQELNNLTGYIIGEKNKCKEELYRKYCYNINH